MEPDRKIACCKRFVTALIMLMGLAQNALSQDFAPPDAAARQQMLVSTAWLAQHLADKDLVLLCVANSAGYYPEGHIPGARLINLSDIVIKRGDVPNELPPVEQLIKVFRAAGVTPRSRIVIYGDDYNLLAARTYYTLDYLGLAEHAALLDGGLNKWKSELRPLTKVEPKPSPAADDFTPHLNQTILVDTAEMKKITAAGTRPALLDARPTAEFSGERHSADVHKLGHIPGARSLYWQELLLSRENPVLLPPAELRQKFQAAGAAPGSSVVSYCRTGMQSSFVYFVAKYLGYPVRMYDASFFEWSMEDLPSEVSN